MSRWRRIAWLHLPCVAWGTFVEVTGRVCPLTPLENWLYARAGQEGYPGGFLEHYLGSALYPSQLTVEVQWALAGGLLLSNGLVYGWILRRGTGTRP